MPQQGNDDLGLDRRRAELWFDVGEVWADMTNEPPELIQIISLSVDPVTVVDSL